MGSGILLAVLVVLWIVVLVPMVLRRSGADTATTSEGMGSTMRILHRRGAKPGVTETAMDVLKRPLRDPMVEADVVARRRRTLAGLVGLALLWAVLAIFVRSYFWTAQIVLDLIVFGYIVYLRLEAQREAERRERRAVRFAERPTGPRPPTRRFAHREPTFSDADVTGPIARVTVPKPAPARSGWAPNPVPVPTYVNKATAPRRAHQLDEQLVSIDDDDLNFAPVEEWHGRRAVGD